MALSFVDDLNAAFRAMARTLRRGGALVISERHPQILRAERAAARASLSGERAPSLRYIDADGEERRIAQHPHLLGDYLAAAQAAGLTFERLLEPLCDHRLATTYANLGDKIELPLAFALRLRRTGTMGT